MRLQSVSLKDTKGIPHPGRNGRFIPVLDSVDNIQKHNVGITVSDDIYGLIRLK